MEQRATVSSVCVRLHASRACGGVRGRGVRYARVMMMAKPVIQASMVVELLWDVGHPTSRTLLDVVTVFIDVVAIDRLIFHSAPSHHLCGMFMYIFRGGCACHMGH